MHSRERGKATAVYVPSYAMRRTSSLQVETWFQALGFAELFTVLVQVGKYCIYIFTAEKEQEVVFV